MPKMTDMDKALSEKTGFSTLKRLARQGSYEVQRAVASNPSATGKDGNDFSVLEKLVTLFPHAVWDNPSFQLALFSPPDRSNYSFFVILARYASGEDLDRVRIVIGIEPIVGSVSYAAATSRISDEGILDTLSTRDSLTRSCVAKHPHASIETIRRLSNDTDETVIRNACTRKDLPEDLLVELASSPRVDIRAAVASRIPLEQNLCEAMYEDESPEVRDRVASGCKDPKILAKMASVSNQRVPTIISLIRNDRLPIENVRFLATHPEDSVRRLVADRKDADEAILKFLSKDEDKWVRRNVVQNKNTPTHVLEDMLKMETSDFVRDKILMRIRQGRG